MLKGGKVHWSFLKYCSFAVNQLQARLPTIIGDHSLIGKFRLEELDQIRLNDDASFKITFEDENVLDTVK